jgi:hypothetical protein
MAEVMRPVVSPSAVAVTVDEVIFTPLRVMGPLNSTRSEAEYLKTPFLKVDNRAIFAFH